MSSHLMITGASGFIGGSLATHFSQQGLDVTGVSIDEVHNASYPVYMITYRVEEICKLINELQPSVLIHAAGSASVGDSLVNPARDYAGSVGLFQTVLEGIRQSGHRPRVVFPSSAAVYGNPETLPVKETAELKPISPYGYHKVMCELLAREYSACFSIPALIVRVFSTFGPKQKRLLLWELFQQCLTEPKVVVEGTGNESRDDLYIEDLAEVLMRVLPKLKEGCLHLNIASGTSVTVKEVCESMKRHLSSEKPVVYRGKVRTGDPTHWQADISRYEILTGEHIQVDFNKRLKENLDQWLKLRSW